MLCYVGIGSGQISIGVEDWFLNTLCLMGCFVRDSAQQDAKMGLNIQINNTTHQYGLDTQDKVADGLHPSYAG